jgi:predicted Zn finger-like uncharacterized protein
MLIVCPNCATSYDVDVASLRPDGRQVRCVRCRAVWQAEIPHKQKLLAAAEALAPALAPGLAPAPDPADAAGDAAATAAQAPPPSTEVDPDGSAGPGSAEAPQETSGPTATDALAQGGAEAARAEGPDVAEDTPVEAESPPTVPIESEYDLPPVDIEAEPAEAQDEALEDVESAAARHFSRPSLRVRWRWPLSRLQSAMLALIVLDAIVVSWRGDFVRALPQTASFYAWLGLPVNVRGLDFDGLITTTEQHDGVPILVVSGKIINVKGKTETVPHLRFSVRNAAHQEIYSWSAVPPRSVLASGEAVVFQTRLASPPPDSHDVLVRFVNRYDILVGMH